MRFVSFTVTIAMISAVSLLAGQNVSPAREPQPPPEQAREQEKLTIDQQSVLRTLREIAHAQLTRDVAAFGRLTAEEFVHFDADGSLTNKQDWLRILEDEPPRLTTAPEPLDAPVRLAPGMLVRVVGTTAVVAATAPSAVKDQSGRILTVLVKRGTDWQQLLVNRQVAERTSAK
jgi:Domain of unknown function (DUF4440)